MRHSLTDPELHLLLTGDPSIRPGRYPGWVRPFTLISPAGRDELRELWFKYREEILKQWKAEGRRGKPWAEKEFSNE
jgi:hypothetical protein